MQWRGPEGATPNPEVLSQAAGEDWSFGRGELCQVWERSLEPVVTRPLALLEVGPSLSVVFRRRAVVFEFACPGGTSLVKANVNDGVLIELDFRTAGDHGREYRPG